MILETHEKMSKELFATGVLARDIDECRALHAGLAGADSTQVTAKQTAKLSTGNKDQARQQPTA